MPIDPARSLANAAAAAQLWAGLAARCRDVVMSPGSRNTPLVLAAWARADLRLHVVLDERAAAFMALGLARQSGRPVALLCTSGSAGAHYLPALCEADQSRIPLIAITADRPPELHACGAPQTMAQAGLFGCHVRHERTLFDLTEAGWRHAGLVAADRAVVTPAGPVHLNVALREPLWSPGCELPAPEASLPAHLGASRLAQDALQSLADRLSNVPRGVLFCGARQGDGDVSAAAMALARATGWPLLAAATSGVRFGPHLEAGRVIGAFDAIIEAELLPPPDVAVQLGAAPLNKSTLCWLSAAGHVLRIDPAGARRDPLLAGGSLVVADAAATLAGLADLVVGAASGWRQAWLAAEDAAQDAIDSAAEPLLEVGVARAVAGALPAGTPLLVAASMPSRDLNAFARPRALGPEVFGNRGLNGIDGLVATAAGHALEAGRATLLCGDLALLHDVGGLLAAVTSRARLDLVVVDNGGGGIFGELPIHAHPTAFEPCFLTPQAASIPALCRGAGAAVHVLKSTRELAQLLMSEASGVRVLVVPVDRVQSAAHRKQTGLDVAAAARAAVEAPPYKPAAIADSPQKESI